MRQKRTDRLKWPTFDSTELQEVATAFLRRRKALGYHAELSCDQEFSETAGGASERFNLDLRDGFGDLRLSVWQDGVMWFRLCVRGSGTNSSWAFMDCFHGSVQDVSAETLVAMIEATIAEPFRPGSSDPLAYRERLRMIWRRVQPSTIGTGLG
jgi:hypothetical protein